MSPNQSPLIVLCLIALVAAIEVGANPLADKETLNIIDDQSQLADDGGLFLPVGQECKGPNEELHPGAVPTCEPTCSNPRPMCLKVFYTSLDFVPCFCKKPLVRNEQTKECIELSKCPK